MKKSKPPQGPLVTSVASVIKNARDTRLFTAEEVIGEKRKIHKTLTDALDIFIQKMKQGEVDMSNSLDLERLVKLMLLVMGEPEGVAQTEEKETRVTFAEPLSLDDPDVKSVYERLTESYNEHNDRHGDGGQDIGGRK